MQKGKLMPTKYFSPVNKFKEAWPFLFSNFFLLIGITLVYVCGPTVINIIESIISPYLSDPAAGLLAFALGVLSYLVKLVLDLGIVKICLNIIDRKPVEFKDIIVSFDLIITYIYASFIFYLIFLGGMLLLIIPGIVWAIKYSFYPFVIIDKKLGAFKAIKASGELTDGVKWQLFGFFLLSLLLTLLGLICLLAGVLVVFPLVILAQALIYRKLDRETYLSN